MKTIRVLYPDYASGGLNEYYLGANLLAHIIPPNDAQPLIKVPIAAPNDAPKAVLDGIYARDGVTAAIKAAQNLISRQEPGKIITIGGSCIVSLAAFDYLHGRYGTDANGEDNGELGILWIDAHPDVSTPKDGYAYAHAMVLGSLLGDGDDQISSLMKNAKFSPQNLLYVGLQGIHDYQENYLNAKGVKFKIQDKEFIKDSEILAFIGKFKHVLVHFDIDVLDAKFFHSTYFANPNLKGDGSGSGKMKMDKLKQILALINANSSVVGLSIAEYLPFDAYSLRDALSELDIFR